MDPILDKARAGQNLIERIVNHIPGYAGYRDREVRRDSDKLQREHLATRLEETKKTFNEVSNAATRGGSLDAINDVETARKRLDRVVARIRYADRGYAGFFDTVKVDEAVLARVYEFDLGLIDGVDAIRQATSAAASAPDVRVALQAVIAEIDALDSRLGEREEILGGIR